MSSLGTNGLYSNWSESILTIPIVLALTSSVALTASTVHAISMSLKNGTYNLINSLKVQISNNEVCNSQTLTNMKVHYDVVSSYSSDDVKTIGSILNMGGIDSAESERYQPAASYMGVGLCNNDITASVVTNSFTPAGGYGGFSSGNASRRERMRSTSFDPNNATNNSILSGITQATCQNLAKNYVANSVANGLAAPILFYITAIIPLSCLHDVFRKLPLTKNMYMKIDLGLNTNFTVAATITGIGAAATYTGFTTSGSAQTCPFQLSSLGAVAATTAKGISTTADTTLTATIGIGKVGTNTAHVFQSCRLHVASYTLSPQQEEEYLLKSPA